MVKYIVRLFLSLTVILFVLPSPAYAHLIGGNGLNSGLSHPFLGLDHLLAMVAVGIISTQIGGKAVWTVPATFVSFMVIGGSLAVLGISMPYIETGIALSVLVLGAGIALSKKFSLGMSLACVALFALFHGHSHGEEIPLIAHPTVYATGFVLSTTFLHITGVSVGKYAQKTKLGFKILRFSGAAISLAGIYFLLGF